LLFSSAARDQAKKMLHRDILAALIRVLAVLVNGGETDPELFRYLLRAELRDHAVDHEIKRLHLFYTRRGIIPARAGYNRAASISLI